MREHRVTLTIEGIDEGQIDRLLNGLHETARDLGPVVDSHRGSDRVEVTMALEARDAAEAIEHAARRLKTALANAVLKPRPVLHAEAELVSVDEVAAA